MIDLYQICEQGQLSDKSYVDKFNESYVDELGRYPLGKLPKDDAPNYAQMALLLCQDGAAANDLLNEEQRTAFYTSIELAINVYATKYRGARSHTARVITDSIVGR